MKVFLSYSHADKEPATRLARALSAAGLDVWSESHVLPGDNWAEQVAEALHSSDAMVVLLSPEAVATHSVRREIDFALGSPQYTGRLIPILIRPTDDIPWILKRLQMLRVDPKRIASIAPRIVQHLKQPA